MTNSSLMEVMIVSSGTADTSPSATVSLNGGKVLINAGEGLQRYSTEHNIRLSKIEAIVLPALEWRFIGGLAGLILTVTDSGMRSCHLVGPVGLRSLIAAMNSFLFRPGFELFIHEVSEELFTLTLPSGMKIAAVGSAYLTDNQIFDQALASMFPPASETNPHQYPSSQNLLKVPPIDYRNLKGRSIVFTIASPAIPGKLDQSEACRLGVSPGPAFRQLKLGEPVITPSGAVVHPSQCVSASRRPQSILWIQSEAALSLWKQVASDCQLIISLEPQVNADAFRTRTLHRFPPSTAEVLGPLAFVSFAEFQASLAEAVSDQMFRCPLSDEFSSHPEFLKSLDSFTFTSDELVMKSEKSPSPSLPVRRNSSHLQLPEAFLLFLGTGSAIPSKYRNVSSFLLGFPSRKSFFLFDCGEGTMGQLWRFFGSETCEILRNLSAIFITHKHADHHLGIVSFLQNPLCTNVIAVYPGCMDTWIRSVAASTHNLVPIGPDGCAALKRNGIRAVQCILMPHCEESYGFIVTVEGINGRLFKIAYSGDTPPFPQFSHQAAGSDVFVHECTYDDSKEVEAQERAHCTVSQALAQCAIAQAKLSVLTHFSQRYSKRLMLDSSSSVLLAFDGMMVPLDRELDLSEISDRLGMFFARLAA